MESVLPCNNSPLSMSILQSCGKEGDDHSNCFLLYLVRWIYLGMSHHPCQCSKCCFFCSYVESMYFTSVDCKNIHNLKVKSYVLFSGNFEDFRPRRQHFKLKNWALFCIPYRSKCQGSLKSFPWYAPQLSGVGLLNFSLCSRQGGLQLNDWEIASIILLPKHTQGSEFHIWRVKLLMAVTSWFIDTARNSTSQVESYVYMRHTQENWVTHQNGQ